MGTYDPSKYSLSTMMQSGFVPSEYQYGPDIYGGYEDNFGTDPVDPSLFVKPEQGSPAEYMTQNAFGSNWPGLTKGPEGNMQTVPYNNNFMSQPEVLDYSNALQKYGIQNSVSINGQTIPKKKFNFSTGLVQGGDKATGSYINLAKDKIGGLWSKFQNSGTGQHLSKYGSAYGAAADVGSSLITSFLGQKSEYNGPNGAITSAIDTTYDTAANTVMQFNPMIGGIMKGAGLLGQGISALGGGTDGMTKADSILGSNIGTFLTLGLNGFLGKKADTITKDALAFERVGSSYGGTSNTVEEALKKSGKKYGAVSEDARKEANLEINEAKRQQGIMAQIGEDATNAFDLVNSMAEINGTALGYRLSGGYRQGAVHAAKHGSVLELVQEPTEIALVSPMVELKEGGQISSEIILINPITNIKEFQDGGPISNNEVQQENPIEYALRRFPILGKLPVINLQYDPNFNPKEDLKDTGDHYGDIEYIEAQYDDLPYYMSYPKWDQYKGQSTIVYNDNASYEDIALDWLSYGLREHDQQWRNYLQRLTEDEQWSEAIEEQLFNSFMEKKDISPGRWRGLSEAKKYRILREFDKYRDDPEIYNSVVDGLVRGIVVDPGHRQSYGGDKEYEMFFKPLSLSPVWQEAYQYLMGGLEKFKEGGAINVIPEGALHARLHHMDLDGVTKKGIPVIAENGGEIEQQAEIEREEIIFRLEVTKKLEELEKDGSEEAALEAGKLLVQEILYNTIDNTNNLL